MRFHYAWARGTHTRTYAQTLTHFEPTLSGGSAVLQSVQREAAFLPAEPPQNAASLSTEYSSQSLLKYQLEENDRFLDPNIFTGYVFKITCLGLSMPRSAGTHPTGSCGPTGALDLLQGVASTLLLLPVSGSAELLAAGSGSDCCPESDGSFLNHLRISIVSNKWKLAKTLTLSHRFIHIISKCAVTSAATMT